MMTPKYSAMHSWENYSHDIMTEYQQSLEEGKDICAYQPLFEAVSKMPLNDKRARMADVLFDLISDAPVREGYAYNEPDELEEIRALRANPTPIGGKLPEEKELFEKIYGAWVGRICGCLLGKPVEGICTEQWHPFLKETNNFPLRRYVSCEDATEERRRKYWGINLNWLPERTECAPADDDTNYTVLAQVLIKRYGRDFKSEDMMNTWLDYQPKNAYCTAERVAFCNFVKGFRPHESAKFQNPYREWIGAQIRGDYFGYINPGNPELAAEMAWRDAYISHIKNGIYGEMFVAAMLAGAAVENDIEKIIEIGLNQIPSTSRLYESVRKIIGNYKNGMAQDACFEDIHSRYDEHTAHGWCHTISNAMIVAASLLYGQGDYGKSICMAVQTGFDTDCNGATVGSILGMRGGIGSIGDEWKNPIHGQLQTSIFGVGRVNVEEMAKKTMQHMAK